MKNPDFVFKVLKFFSEQDFKDELMWNVEEDEIKFAINCSDFFWWGTCDAEDLTPENFQTLVDSFEDCEKINSIEGDIYAPSLFCSRIRKMRPQGCCYPKDEKLWQLFDNCGPEREVSLGNPYKPGEYK